MHVHSHAYAYSMGELAMHRFEDHHIQTRSDSSTEPCTGSKTIRSKPIQIGAPSLAQVQRPSDANPFGQGHRALHRFKDHQIQTRSSKGTEQAHLIWDKVMYAAYHLHSIASRWQPFYTMCKHYLVAVEKMDGCQSINT